MRLGAGSWRRRAWASLSAALLVAAMAAVAWGGTFEKPDRVRVASTGDNSELVTGIPITTDEGPSRTVVMSLPPDRLPSLAKGDRLEPLVEAEVTTDCIDPSPRCVGNPYDYNPVVDADLILAPDAASTGGDGTITIASASRPCVQQLSDRQHHCVIVFDDVAQDFPDGRPACAPECHLNLVLSAHHPDAQPGDQLIVGEDEPDGSTVQDKGRLGVVRLRPTVRGPRPRQPVKTYELDTPDGTALPVGAELQDAPTVLFSQELNKMKKNEQLAVRASFRTDVSSLPYNVLVSSRLILARSPDATEVSDRAVRIDEFGGEISETNGFNCAHPDSPCQTRKVGVSHLLDDYTASDGEQRPVYVNLVVRTAARRATPQPGDAMPVDSGHLEIRRFPPRRYG